MVASSEDAADPQTVLDRRAGCSGLLPGSAVQRPGQPLFPARPGMVMWLASGAYAIYRWSESSRGQLELGVTGRLVRRHGDPDQSRGDLHHRRRLAVILVLYAFRQTSQVFRCGSFRPAAQPAGLDTCACWQSCRPFCITLAGRAAPPNISLPGRCRSPTCCLSRAFTWAG